MAGPYVYPNPMSLVGKEYVPDAAGKYLGQCVSLVKHFIPELQNRSSSTWIKGSNVIETLKKGGSIRPGTAIAAFKNGRYISGDGHACFYAGYEENTFRIHVVDQYLGEQPSNGIIHRLLHNKGKRPDGSYNDPSNNGKAFSVIL